MRFVGTPLPCRFSNLVLQNSHVPKKDYTVTLPSTWKTFDNKYPFYNINNGTNLQDNFRSAAQVQWVQFLFAAYVVSLGEGPKESDSFVYSHVHGYLALNYCLVFFGLGKFKKC